MVDVEQHSNGFDFCAVVCCGCFDTHQSIQRTVCGCFVMKLVMLFCLHVVVDE